MEVISRYGIDSTVLMPNYIEALAAIGEWDSANRVSVVALRAVTADHPYMLVMNRADIEIGLGRFDNARSHRTPKLEQLAQRARLDLAEPDPGPPHTKQSLAGITV